MSDVPSSAVEMEVPEETSSPRASASAREPILWPRRQTPGWRYALLRRMLALGDVIAVLLAIVGIVAFGEEQAQFLTWSLVFLPLWVILAKLLGLYDHDQRSLRHGTTDELPRIAVWALIGASLLSASLEVTPAGHLPTSSAVAFGVVLAIAAVLLRIGTRRLWRAVTPPERVAVIGTAETISAFERKCGLFPDMHMRIEVGIGAAEFPAIWDSNGSWLGRLDRLVFAPGTLEEERLTEIIESARAIGITLNVIFPPSSMAFGSGVHLGRLAEVSVLEYRTADLPRSTLAVKRALDLIVSAGALVLLLPVFAVIAVVIKLDSRGPVIFSQLRAGFNGRPYRLYKFRSMAQDAEEQLKSLASLEELIELRLKLPNDPRVTRVGRVLRRWSLDELPQLANVLKGEMSIVGPRPEQLPVVRLYPQEHRVRLRVKPGITGPMQVYGRGETTWDERLALEADYAENLSISRDLWLMLSTVGVVLARKGAS